MPRHVSWKYRFPRKFWESTHEILRGTTRVHACKNEVIIERYCIYNGTLLHCELQDYSLEQIAFTVFQALFAITQLLFQVQTGIIIR